ncbi:hypothetical protein AAMO2058_001003300 [Amorphochlora amoebiformis]
MRVPFARGRSSFSRQLSNEIRNSADYCPMDVPHLNFKISMAGDLEDDEHPLLGEDPQADSPSPGGPEALVPSVERNLNLSFREKTGVPIWFAVALVVVFFVLVSIVNIWIKWLLNGPLRTPAFICATNQTIIFILAISSSCILPEYMYKRYDFSKLALNDWIAIGVIAVGYILNVGMRNISLLYFTLALSQLIRGFVPVLVWFTSHIVEHRRLDYPQMVSLVVLVAGILIASAGSKDFSFGIGLYLSISSCFGSTCMIVATGYLVRRRPSLHVIDIMIFQAPFAAVVMPFVAIATQDYKALTSSYEKNGPLFVIGTYLSFGLLGFFFTLVVYNMIKWTSSVYYAVAGGFRFPLILGLSFVFFHQSVTTLGIIGMTVACVGFLSNSVSELCVGEARYAKDIRVKD